MLKLIIHPSTLLLNFLLSLCLSLSKPQRLHILRTVEALIVTDERKTLSELYRQWVEAPDVSAVADFFRQDLRKFPVEPLGVGAIHESPLLYTVSMRKSCSG